MEVGSVEDSEGAAWSSRRADARRNHGRVLAAATEVFTEQGLDATIPDVAARAGVGKATVYRSFPTKDDLIQALAQAHIDWINEQVAAAAAQAESDAAAALRVLLDRLVTRMASDRLMAAVLEGRRFDRTQAEDGLGRIVACGLEQGAFREDVSVLDIRVLLSGVARSLFALEIRDLDTWRRYADLIVAALLA